MKNRRTFPDRRRIVRRKKDRYLFLEEFSSISENMEILKEIIKKLQKQEKSNKEAAKIFQPLLNDLEKQILSLDKKIFTLHSYWTSIAE